MLCRGDLCVCSSPILIHLIWQHNIQLILGSIQAPLITWVSNMCLFRHTVTWTPDRGRLWLLLGFFCCCFWCLCVFSGIVPKLGELALEVGCLLTCSVWKPNRELWALWSAEARRLKILVLHWVSWVRLHFSVGLWEWSAAKNDRPTVSSRGFFIFGFLLWFYPPLVGFLVLFCLILS